MEPTGSHFAVVRDPAARERLREILQFAIQGCLRHKVNENYTNIALMNAFMLWFAGDRLRQPAWVEAGENMAREVYRLFKRHDTFEEYNSPTYYGPDMYALAQWRAYAASPVLRDLGAEMEALLWMDIARFYHAGLRNLCGPFDRSYGMDMRKYVACSGEWIWLAVGQELAPVPDLARPFAHASDFLFAPPAAILGAAVPAAALPDLAAFRGQRQVERFISDSPLRVATAWLCDRLIIGAEKSSRVRPINNQFHAATMHWRMGAADVGWMKLLHSEPVDARAGKNRLDITAGGDIIFHVFAPQATKQDIQPGRWRLPNLIVEVTGAGQAVDVNHLGDLLEIRYPAAPEQERTLSLSTQTS